MKLAILCQTSMIDFINGMRKATELMHDLTDSDLYLLTWDKSVETERYNVPGLENIPSDYDATLLSTCLFETDNASIIDLFPRPRMLYLHAWDSLKHSNWRYMDKIDVLLYDRPMLAKHFIEEYPSFDKPYRELTLPYIPEAEWFSPSRCAKQHNLFVSHGRISQNRQTERILEAAAKCPRLDFIILAPDFQKEDKRMLYAKEMEERALDLSNVSFQYCGFGDSYIRLCLDHAQFYIGSTKDLSGHGTYGVEYAAMEAMDHGCVPVIYDEMEFEYRRQGARAAFFGDSPLSQHLLNAYYGREHIISNTVERNYEFLRKKNTRFHSQLQSIVDEFKV